MDYVADKLSEVDPEGADQYEANAIAYVAEIETSVKKAEKLLSTIPAESRILIMGHDAFNCFWRHL